MAQLEFQVKEPMGGDWTGGPGTDIPPTENASVEPFLPFSYRA